MVRKTLLSAALQEYPNRRVVLLIDDPPNPASPNDSRTLAAARRLPGEVQALLDDVKARCECALREFQERCASGSLQPAEGTARIAQLYRDVATWFEGQAHRYEILDHTDRVFVDLTFLKPAKRYRQKASARMDGRGFSARCPNTQDLLVEYSHILRRFQVEIKSFERKGYVNLSHEPNKAMNLNSYIGLMGKKFHERRSVQGIFLELSSAERADLEVPDADFVLMVDADSVLAADYALRLIHFMRQPGNTRVAVAQTPYSAFPGAPGVLERIAGATTDIQYLIHQGFTHYEATFWVGANAVVRKAALEDIAEQGSERGYPIRRFIQDRTVIEDTESSLDLVGRDWSLYNYPERLAFSATPPDFGSLLIQRRRWANGGLLILPKLVRHVLRRTTRRGIAGEALMRCHYLTSLAAVNLGLLVVLGFSFEQSMRSFWLPLTALPYYGLYLRDLQRAGYRWSDLLRVYALNLVLIPVNLGGVFCSLYQVGTGRKSAFGRTPKVTGRTMAPALYLVIEYVLVGQWLVRAVVDAVQGRAAHAAFAAANAGCLSYGIVRFIGLRESRADLVSAWQQARERMGRTRIRLTPLAAVLGRVGGIGRRFVSLAAATCFILTPASVAALTEMAITVDDLPTHGPMPKGTSRIEIARRMLQTFSKHRVAQAYGFVNGKQVQDSPEHLPILEEWAGAGFPLGNHTFSHPKLDEVTPEEFIADIKENERFLSRLSRASSFKPFRYPYLAEGDSLKKRNAVRAWLAAHGYRIAQVTVYFDDWAWNDPYTRCLAQEDLHSIDWLKRSFIESASSQLRWSKEAARVMLKRPMKQILLLHVGAFDSIMLDDLLTAYEKTGVAFIDLESATRDPAYRVNPNIPWRGELAFFGQLARAKRMTMPPDPESPLRQLEGVCR